MNFLFTFLINASLFSQQYKYTLTLPGAMEDVVIKELSKKVYGMFDQSAEFEAHTYQLIQLPSPGIYFIRVTTQDRSLTEKIIY